MRFCFVLKIIAAVISTWVWANFEREFSKSDRIDVDPECKWIINAAIEVATRNLNALTSKINKIVNQTGQESSVLSSEHHLAVQISIVTFISQGLSRGLSCNEEMVSGEYLFYKRYDKGPQNTHTILLPILW